MNITRNMIILKNQEINFKLLKTRYLLKFNKS